MALLTSRGRGDHAGRRAAAHAGGARRTTTAIAHARRARYTYGELADRALRVARNLIGLGVAPGEHVGVLMPNGFDILATYFGVSLAGCAIVPDQRPLPHARARLHRRQRRPGVRDHQRRQRRLRQLPRPADREHRGPRRRAAAAHDGRARQARARGRAERRRVRRARCGRDRGRRSTAAATASASPTRRWSSTPRGTTADPRGAIISHESIVRVWGGRRRARDAARPPTTACGTPARCSTSPRSASRVACAVHGVTIVTAPFFEPDSAVELLERERPTALYPGLREHPARRAHAPALPRARLSATRALVVGPPTTLRSLQDAAPRPHARLDLRHDRELRLQHVQRHRRPARGRAWRPSGRRSRAWSCGSPTR